MTSSQDISTQVQAQQVNAESAHDFRVEIITSISQVKPADWDALTDGTPLLSHAFLSALENSGSVGQGTGWMPHPLVIKLGGKLIAAMPLYLKNHSYGEYVFDWAWADAYQHSGFNYYPKLLSAIPFSPITSRRLLTEQPELQMMVIEALENVMQQHQLSSVHVLFPDESCAQQLQAAGWLKRTGVQFRWQNKKYPDFEAFLATLSHDKRKKIHQERKKVSQAGIVCRQIKGADASERDWDFFYDCYTNTYREHHSTPYLTRSFFAEIAKTMPDNLLLIVAEIDGNPIASALNIYNRTTLYGRYWGATQFVSGLHFELCYYQAQQFCIAEDITFFEGGAQGEHKLARGFEPRSTCSYHKIAHPDFERAIKQFLSREAEGVTAYTNELEERAPFKHTVL
ncbi:GNAT family N-acetyltransferase [Methylotenera versatilis]|uniref:GNAT family N-acetyltransferase n=1 Tax=Methylotenera versatilis TaxID=1055487 RepID=UPI0006490340|nr:GNAT family N-acetyltransferase [Methylotenera versatilis]